MHYQILKMDQSSQEPIIDLVEEDESYPQDPTKEFEDILRCFVVEPFGEKLNQDLIDLFTEIDFSPSLIQEVRKLNKRTPRRLQRKP